MKWCANVHQHSQCSIPPRRLSIVSTTILIAHPVKRCWGSFGIVPIVPIVPCGLAGHVRLLGAVRSAHSARNRVKGRASTMCTVGIPDEADTLDKRAQQA